MLYQIFCVILILVIILKLWTILRSIRWIKIHGEKHAQELREKSFSQILTEEDFLASFSRHQGAFFPFGIKEYKLQTVFYRIKSRQNISNFTTRVVKFIIEPLSALLFRYRGLSLASTILTVVITLIYYFQDELNFDLPESIPYLVYTVSLGTIAMNFGSCLQFIFGQLFMTDYAKYFHMITPHKNTLNDQRQLSTNLKLILLLAFSIFINGFAAVFSTYLMFDGFGGGVLDDYEEVNFADLPVVASYFFYYVLSTMTTTGFGDLNPINPAGVVISACLQIQAFTLVIFVFEVFWASRFTSEKK